MMKKILLLATGGTIASKVGKNGLEPQVSAEELLSYVPEIREFCVPTAKQVYNIDSTNVTPRHWEQLIRAIQENYDDYDGFVICHGTDTLAYTAAVLSYTVQHSEKPIVLTGSQKPIDKEDTDARINLRDSFLYATDELASDVVIVFQGQVIAGTRAKKTRTKSYNAFKSMDLPELARIRDGKIIRYITTPKQGKPTFYPKLNSRVGLVSITPGLQAKILDAYFEHNDAVILSGYGTGGIPEGESFGYYEVIEKWEKENKVVAVTTQVQNEGSDLNIYSVGRDFKERFSLLESGDMTFESVLAKLMWILAITDDKEKIRDLFNTTINYDRIG